jgi:hypothetical protein
MPMLWRLFALFLYSIIIYTIVGLRGGVERFLVFYLALVMQTLANTALGLLLAAASRDRQRGMLLACSAFAFNILFSGTFYIVDTVTWVLRWLEFISASFYTAQMMSQNELSGRQQAETLLNNTVQYDQVGLWLSFILLWVLIVKSVSLGGPALYVSFKRMPSQE